jgi:hypothetical protein
MYASQDQGGLRLEASDYSQVLYGHIIEPNMLVY